MVGLREWRGRTATRPQRGDDLLQRQWIALLSAAAVLSAATALLVLARHRPLAGVAAGLAAAGLVAGTAGARTAGSRRGALAELLLDRAFDAAVLAPVAWTARSADPGVAAAALVAMIGAFVASYERARARSLGYRASEGVVYRTVRSGLLALALLTGWLSALLWLVAALTAAASGVRAWNMTLQEHRIRGRGARAPA
jgi:hypothetical protein